VLVAEHTSLPKTYMFMARSLNRFTASDFSDAVVLEPAFSQPSAPIRTMLLWFLLTL